MFRDNRKPMRMWNTSTTFRQAFNGFAEYYEDSSNPLKSWHTKHPYPTPEPLQTFANLAGVTQTYGGDAAAIVAIEYILAKSYETLGENPSVEQLYDALFNLKKYCDCACGRKCKCRPKCKSECKFGPGKVQKWNVRDKKLEWVRDLERCTCTCVQKAVFDAKGGLHGGQESKATNGKVNRFKKFLCVNHPSRVPLCIHL